MSANMVDDPEEGKRTVETWGQLTRHTALASLHFHSVELRCYEPLVQNMTQSLAEDQQVFERRHSETTILLCDKPLVDDIHALHHSIR